MVDGVGCTHPSSALHHPDIHGPADHRRHCKQEGAQAEGKGLREENPTPTPKNANTFVWDNTTLLDRMLLCIIDVTGSKQEGNLYRKTFQRQQINLVTIRRSVSVLKCQQQM